MNQSTERPWSLFYTESIPIIEGQQLRTHNVKNSFVSMQIHSMTIVGTDEIPEQYLKQELQSYNPDEYKSIFYPVFTRFIEKHQILCSIKDSKQGYTVQARTHSETDEVEVEIIPRDCEFAAVRCFYSVDGSLTLVELMTTNFGGQAIIDYDYQAEGIVVYKDNVLRATGDYGKCFDANKAFEEEGTDVGFGNLKIQIIQERNIMGITFDHRSNRSFRGVIPLWISVFTHDMITDPTSHAWTQLPFCEEFQGVIEKS